MDFCTLILYSPNLIHRSRGSSTILNKSAQSGYLVMKQLFPIEYNTCYGLGVNSFDYIKESYILDSF